MPLLLLLCFLLVSTEACTAQQVISAHLRYFVHVPERLSVELTPVTIRHEAGRVMLCQQVHVQTQPAEGLVLAVSVEESGKRVAEQELEVPTPLLGPPRLVAVAGKILWIRGTPRETWGRVSGLGAVQPSVPREFRLEIEVEMVNQTDRTEQSTVLTMTAFP